MGACQFRRAVPLQWLQLTAHDSTQILKALTVTLALDATCIILSLYVGRLLQRSKDSYAQIVWGLLTGRSCEDCYKVKASKQTAPPESCQLTTLYHTFEMCLISTSVARLCALCDMLALLCAVAMPTMDKYTSL